MPVTFTRLENSIYHVQLEGEIPLAELVEVQQNGLNIARSHDDGSYVLIIEIATDTRMPFDIRKAGQIIDNDGSLAVISVGATFYMKFIVSVLARMFSLGHVEHLRTVTEAVDRARHLLQTHIENSTY